MKKVYIKRLPNKQAGGEITISNFLPPSNMFDANVEAEKGETVVMPGSDGYPEHYTIGGKRHYDGGTPLNLPDDSFIFSDTKAMKIKDPEILKRFGKGGNKKSYTPADLAKQYNINKYKKILLDPNSNKLERETAEKMIAKYNLKLGELALVQESMKGFDQGLPEIAMPYLETMGISPQDFFGEEQGDEQFAPMMQMGGQPDVNQYISMIQQALSQGVSPEVIYQDLVQQGLEPQDAESLVQEVISQMSQQEQPIMRTGGELKRKVRIKGKPKYDDGGQVQNIKVGNKTYKIPSEATYHETFDRQNVKVGDYVLKDNKVVKINSLSDLAELEEKYLNDKIKDAEYQKVHAFTTKQLEDLKNNPEALKVLLNNFAKALTNSKISKSDKNLMYKVIENYGKNPELLIDLLIKGNTQNMIYNSDPERRKYLQSEASRKEFDKGPGAKSSEGYKKVMQSLGIEDMITDPQDIVAFQAAFEGLVRATQNKETAPLFGKLQGILKDVDAGAYGFTEGDQTIGNNVDGMYGNTTLGYVIAPGISDKDIFEEADLADEIKKDPEWQGLEVEPNVEDDAPWWLQDKVKIAGAAGDYARIKKHTPWQASPDTFLADPTFYDPARQLSSINEQYAIGADAASTFADPQALNARTTQMSGQAAKQAADTLANYNNLNVGVANQFELSNTAMLNQAAREKAQRDTQLYDKWAILNQQFDNSRNQARQNIRQGFIDAITNRAKAQAMNSMFDQFQVDPITGGFINFTQGIDRVPGSGGSSSDGVLDMEKDMLKWKGMGLEPIQIRDLTKRKYTDKTSSATKKQTFEVDELAHLYNSLFS